MTFSYKKILLLLTVFLLSLALLCSCKGNTDPTPSETFASIRVEGKHAIPLGSFRPEDYTIVGTREAGDTMSFAMTESALSAEDLAKLGTLGEHTVTVTCGETSTSLTVLVYDAAYGQMSFESQTFVYDGTAKELKLEGVPEGASVSLLPSTTSYKNAGTYNLTAKITLPGHDPVTLRATLTIEKAVYDMSGVIFADKTVLYEGLPCSIFAENLPEGVQATYKGNGQSVAGVYTVTASFRGDTKNYHPIEDKTATMTVIETGTYAINYNLGSLYTQDKVTSLPDNMPKTYVSGEGLSSIPAPVTPHTFLGWYFDSALTQPAPTIPATTSGNVTLYAKWGGFSILNAGFAGANATVGGSFLDTTGYRIEFGEKQTLPTWTIASQLKGDNTYLLMRATSKTSAVILSDASTLTTLLSSYANTYELSYSVALARGVNETTGELLPCAPMVVRFSFESIDGTNDVTILSVSEDGVVSFNGQTVGTLTAELQTFRFVIDLQAHTAGFYNEAGECLHTMHHPMFDIQYIGTRYFTTRGKTLQLFVNAAAGSAIAIDDVRVALGNSFERGDQNTITYVLPDGVSLPKNADTVYIPGGIGTGLPTVSMPNGYAIHWYDNPDFTGSPIEVLPEDATGDLTFYGKREDVRLTVNLVIDGEIVKTYRANKNTMVAALGIQQTAQPAREGYTFVWFFKMNKTLTESCNLYGAYVPGDAKAADLLLEAYYINNFTFMEYGLDNDGDLRDVATAMLYLITELRRNVTENADGTETVANEPYLAPLREKIVRELRYMVTEGFEPAFDLNCFWEYGLVTPVITLCHETAYVWDTLEDYIQGHYDFIMECFAYILTFGTDDNNNYSTGPGLRGNYNKLWNPNYRLASVLPMLYVGQYFGGGEEGADKVDEMLLSFDYDKTIERMMEHGFMRAYNCWTTPVAVVNGLPTRTQKEFMEKGGIAYMSNGQEAGTGIGVRTEYTYLGYRINNIASIFNSLLAYNYNLGGIRVSNTVGVTWAEGTVLNALGKPLTEETSLEAGTVLLSGTYFGESTVIDGVTYKPKQVLNSTLVLKEAITAPAGSLINYGVTLLRKTTLAKGTLIKKGSYLPKNMMINSKNYLSGVTTSDIVLNQDTEFPANTVFAANTKMGGATQAFSYIYGGENSPYTGMPGQMAELSSSNRSSCNYASHDFMLIEASLLALDSLDLYDLREQTFVAVHVPNQNGYTTRGQQNILAYAWVGNQDYIYKNRTGWTTFSTTIDKVVGSAYTTHTLSAYLKFYEYCWERDFVDVVGGNAEGKFDITDFK